MTSDDVIRMAREAGLLPVDIGPTTETRHMRSKKDSLERFAALVAAAEREACAEVAERGFKYAKDGYQIAAAIRARSAT